MPGPAVADHEQQADQDGVREPKGDPGFVEEDEGQ